MSMKPLDRRILRKQISEQRYRILERWPAMPEAEVDRRTRLRVAFPRGSRRHLAEKVGMSENSLKMLVQGHRRVSFEAAVRICNAFPHLLCLTDLIRLPKGGVATTVNLHRTDLPAYQSKAAA